jgi:hypothetical protein
MSASRILNVAVRMFSDSLVLTNMLKQIVGCGEVAVTVHVDALDQSKRHGS